MKDKVIRIVVLIIASFFVFIFIGCAVGVIGFAGRVFGLITDSYRISQAFDNIEIIEIGYADGPPEEFQALKTIERECYTDFVNALCNVPIYYVTPPDSCMGRMIIKITYQNDECEYISEYGTYRSVSGRVDGSHRFNTAEFAALFEKYGILYEP